MRVPVVEIYTKAFCPYCWRAKALLDRRASSFGRFRSISAAPTSRPWFNARGAGRPCRKSLSTIATSAVATS